MEIKKLHNFSTISKKIFISKKEDETSHVSFILFFYMFDYYKAEKWIVTNIIDYYLILRFKTSF